MLCVDRVVLSRDYAENSLVLSQWDLFSQIAIVEVAGFQYALVISIQELDSIQVLVILYPPDHNLSHDCTFRFDSDFLQRYIAVKFRSFAVQSHKVESTTVLAITLNAYDRIFVSKHTWPLVVLFFLTRWGIVFC